MRDVNTCCLQATWRKLDDPVRLGFEKNQCSQKEKEPSASSERVFQRGDNKPGYLLLKSTGSRRGDLATLISYTPTNALLISDDMDTNVRCLLVHEKQRWVQFVISVGCWVFLEDHTYLVLYCICRP